MIHTDAPREFEGDKISQDPDGTLRIDESFRGLAPPLSGAEREALAASILSEGCRDPLVVWRRFPGEPPTVIDGHNRYEICREHGVPYDTVERGFDSEDGARAWIAFNQLARRNLPPYGRTLLALRFEQLLADAAKERMLVGKKADRTVVREPDDIGIASPPPLSAAQARDLEEWERSHRPGGIAGDPDELDEIGGFDPNSPVPPGLSESPSERPGTRMAHDAFADGGDAWEEPAYDVDESGGAPPWAREAERGSGGAGEDEPGYGSETVLRADIEDPVATERIPSPTNAIGDLVNRGPNGEVPGGDAPPPATAPLRGLPGGVTELFERQLETEGVGGRTDDAVGKLAGVSRDTVRRVKYLRESADEETLGRLARGEESINAAYTRLSSPETAPGPSGPEVVLTFRCPACASSWETRGTWLTEDAEGAFVPRERDTVFCRGDGVLGEPEG